MYEETQCPKCGLPFGLNNCPICIPPVLRGQFSIDEAAAYLNMAPKTVRARIKEGKIEAKMVQGRRGWQYMISEIPTNLTLRDIGQSKQ